MFCLKGRDFEIPMSRGLYLTEYHPELERAYDLQHEIVTYSGFDDLLAKIRYLLAHPEKAEEIRDKGYQRARQEHSWERRFEKLFNLMGLI
jgi:spore maturation protein CgeB